MRFWLANHSSPYAKENSREQNLFYSGMFKWKKTCASVYESFLYLASESDFWRKTFRRVVGFQSSYKPTSSKIPKTTQADIRGSATTDWLLNHKLNQYITNYKPFKLARTICRLWLTGCGLLSLVGPFSQSDDVCAIKSWCQAELIKLSIVGVTVTAQYAHFICTTHNNANNAVKRPPEWLTAGCTNLG